MATYTITVPKSGNWMNANDRPDRWIKAQHTKQWREAGRAAAITVSSRMALPLRSPVRVTATVHIADNRRREVSNLFPTFKACIDGFVDSGILIDDSDKYVEGPDPRRGYEDPPRIVFTLEEAP